VLHKRYGWPALAILLGASVPALFADPQPEEPPSDAPRLARKEEDKKGNPLAQPAVKADGPLVHLTREEYDKLLDEIARLKAKPLPPSICRVTGKIDGDLALLAAMFEFKTTTPNAVVFLACPPPAQPTDVHFSAGTPLFKAEAGGCSVQVEKPGDYKLTLDLLLGLTTKGADRGFELELPRAAITTLDLTLPEGARDVRVGGKPFADALLTFKNAQLAGPLGPGAVEKLDVKWRKPGAVNTPPVLTATARITVQLDDRETRTRAELMLKSEGGPASVWPLIVPAGATVKLANKEDEARVQSIGKADYQKVAELRTIRLKEPANELNVVVTVAGAPPRAGALVPVGPFLLQTALRQSGRITVEKSGLQDVKLDYHPHGDVEAAPGADEFRYATLVPPEKPQGTAGPGSLSLLDIEPRSTRGLVETRVVHTLRLRRDDKLGRVWRVTTAIEATPFGIGVDHLDVLIPPDYVLYDEHAGEFDAATRVLRFKVAAEAPSKTFTRTFELDYNEPAGEAGKATLALPKPVDTRDGGLHKPHQVVIVTEPDEEVLPPEVPPASYDPEGPDPGPQRQSWSARRLPDSIPVAWRPYQPEARAASEIDLTLKGREGHVRQVFHFHFPRPPAVPQVALRFPAALADRWTLTGGTAEPAANNPPVRAVKLGPPHKERGHTLVLDYTFPLADDADALGVPLVMPEQITAGPSKVRVWSEAGVVPTLGEGLWSTAALEEVADQPRWPVLVAQAARLDAPLTLRFGQGKSASPATALVDRVLVRVDVGDDGVQTYRVKYLLTQPGAQPLEVELPAPVPSLNLRVTFDGKEFTGIKTLDESGKEADGGRIARLALPTGRKLAVLEVSYQLQAVRTGSGAWQTALQPPALRGAPGRPPTRWMVTLADSPNLVVLWPDGGPGGEPVWGRRGWLFGPHLALTPADLERWFAGDRDLPSESDSDLSRPLTASSWRQGAEPLTVVHLPQRIWLLTCSLVFLVGWLSLFLLARRSDGSQTAVAGWFWGLLALLPVAVMVGLFLYPTPAAAIVYGCLPGALVVLLVIVFHLVLQERQRRQLVFLPSFRRGGGSSLNRPSKGSAPRHGEPSTVDAPHPNGSQWPTGEVLQPEGSSSGTSGKAG
jgi:hypothetical protein